MTLLTDRRPTVAAASVAAITTLLALGCIVAEAVGPGPSPTSAQPDASAGGVLLVSIQAVMASAFAILGAVVVSRQQRNPVGWLLVVIGFFQMYIAVTNEVYLQVVLNSSGDTPDLTAVALSVAGWAWMFALVPAFTFLPQVFPTGRPLSHRWRVLTWATGVAVVVVIVQTAIEPGPLPGAESVSNPLGVDVEVIHVAGGIASILLLPMALLSIAALVVRFRRSTGTERQQLKWVVTASTLLPAGLLIGLALGGDASWPLVEVALLLVAVAVTVAMLRFRLYDIDVVINRALVYGSLTATLAGTYLGLVLLLQLVLESFTEGSGVAVAVSTLATAAVVRPGRARIQAGVDRRFFRHKYDAARTLESFGAHLRQEVDLETVGLELRRAVMTTVQPAHVGLWVPGPKDPT